MFLPNWTVSELWFVSIITKTASLHRCMPVCFFLCLMLWLCCSELRERILPEILELIKQQRLNRLCEGSCFRKLGNRRRQGKYSSSSVFCFTAAKTLLLLIVSWLLCYALFSQKSSGSADFLWITKCCTTETWMSHLRGKCLSSCLVTRVSNIFCFLHMASFQLINLRKQAAWPCDCLSVPRRSGGWWLCVHHVFLPVPVSDIKSVLTGKDCPHMKEKSALKQNKVLS